MKNTITVLVTAGMLSAFGGSMSSMSVEGYFDNAEVPQVRVVGAGESVSVSVVGDWFDSGECELYLNGERVARSDGSLVEYVLAGAEGDGFVSYNLELKSADGTVRKVVTFFPTYGYKSLVHSLVLGARMLDSRPAGTVRRIHRDSAMDVNWSTVWTNEADRAVVKLYRGADSSGEALGTLVEESEGEGEYALSPKEYPLENGTYTLTHYDGTETLTATVEVKSRCGSMLIVR